MHNSKERPRQTFVPSTNMFEYSHRKSGANPGIGHWEELQRHPILWWLSQQYGRPDSVRRQCHELIAAGVDGMCNPRCPVTKCGKVIVSHDNQERLHGGGDKSEGTEGGILKRKIA